MPKPMVCLSVAWCQFVEDYHQLHPHTLSMLSSVGFGVMMN
jgi:hypothetical protein